MTHTHVVRNIPVHELLNLGYFLREVQIGRDDETTTLWSTLRPPSDAGDSYLQVLSQELYIYIIQSTLLSNTVLLQCACARAG